MTSYRPETSVPSTTSAPAEASAADLEGGTRSPKSDFTLNIFDLVYPTRRVQAESRFSIPPGFLRPEAVDSSLYIGHGASFAVTRQAVPLANQVRRHVVYKSARVRFDADGAPSTAEDHRALLGVLTELHALLHPPLRQHPNIISLVGLAWGSNYANPSHQLPVLVVEYGDMGTLADYQATHPNLNLVTKTDLCRGIARGLQALHGEGIIHGDVKPENIIICSDGEGKPVPKLADFGFSILDSPGHTSIRIGGTRTWRAPESFGSVPVNKLPLTDIYSFGLLVWSVAADGKNPFELILSPSVSQEKFLGQVDRLKMSDEVLAASQPHKWLFALIMDKLSSEINVDNQSTAEKPLFDPATLRRHSKIFEIWKSANTQMKQMILKTAESFPVWKTWVEQPFYRCLDPIFSCTLTKDPDRRNLKTVISILEGEAPGLASSLTGLSLQTSEEVSSSVAKKTETLSSADQAHSNSDAPSTAVASHADDLRTHIDWSRVGFKHRWYSWQVMRSLEPNIQKFAVNAMAHMGDAPSRFVLSAFIMNAYGVGYHKENAVDSMMEAAKAGFPLAQANLYRLVTACELALPTDIDILDYLKRQAVNGSRAALSDLHQLSPVAGKHCRKILDYSTGGVGALWYQPDQWLHGLNQGSFLDANFKLGSLGPTPMLADVVVNKRGDRIIHAAAAVGAYSIVKELLEDDKFDINQRNAEGETALLCACRASHPDTVLLLLSNCADASLSASNGETPLHWLSSFMPTVNPALIGKDLIDRGGAKIDVCTSKRISHSCVFKTIDIDLYMPGTPLLWAVHDNNLAAVRFLLSRGADPMFEALGGDGPSPLARAAYFHRQECLEIMIEHIEKNAIGAMPHEMLDIHHKAVNYKFLIKEAVCSADAFSMILRNGTRCLNMLKSTLGYFQKKTAGSEDFWDEDQGLLHFAATHGYWEALRFMLELRWCVDEIDKPAARGGRTAILETVRWNRPDWYATLLKHGASPFVVSASPFDRVVAGRTWSALHVFANQGHEDDMTLVDKLLDAGLPIDGDATLDTETPFNIAVRRNAFKLADHLQSRGAVVNATSTRSSLVIGPYRLTGLGHIIALNARYSTDSLRYMLRSGADFIVNPGRDMSALHLCAVVLDGITYINGGTRGRDDFDWTTNRTIAYELLQHFRAPEQLDRRVDYHLFYSGPDIVVECVATQVEDWMERGKTALHLAAEFGNVGMTELLISAGADDSLVWWNDQAEPESARDIAVRCWSHDPTKLAALTEWLN